MWSGMEFGCGGQLGPEQAPVLQYNAADFLGAGNDTLSPLYRCYLRRDLTIDSWRKHDG